MVDFRFWVVNDQLPRTLVISQFIIALFTEIDYPISLAETFASMKLNIRRRVGFDFYITDFLSQNRSPFLFIFLMDCR